MKNTFGNFVNVSSLNEEKLCIKGAKVFWNQTPSQLIEHTIKNDYGRLLHNGALSVNTGKYTGRAPKDRYIVKDSITEHRVWWGNVNIGLKPEIYDNLHAKMQKYAEGKTLFAKDVKACADSNYSINVRVISEYPWSSMFVDNMFINLTDDELQVFKEDWSVLQFPNFLADIDTDGVKNGNFAIINFTEKQIIIGGTAYTGEIKKGIFSVLNFLLPVEKNTLSMHCSANVGEDGDTAIFFGLSGTGKTTLSSDPKRGLIGDDEHGWSDTSVFNFEGGCYAKTINLSKENEPEIYNAIKYGAILENIPYKTDEPDYTDKSITENTRVSYPLHHIANSIIPSIANVPKNIMFLTADAYGVLPPISKLTKGQAMYHFISGYTAKVAGTEAGVNEPEPTFSYCFGAAFMPLHPTEYAKMLGEKIDKNNVNVWLINTGWSGGPYGVGSRVKLKYTRAMITAALEGKLNDVDYITHPVFGLNMPTTCPNVPSEILNPIQTWDNKKNYNEMSLKLAEFFINNFKKYEEGADEEMLAASPNINASVL